MRTSHISHISCLSYGFFLLLRFSPTGSDSVALAGLPVLGNLVTYIFNISIWNLPLYNTLYCHVRPVAVRVSTLFLSHQFQLTSLHVAITWAWLMLCDLMTAIESHVRHANSLHALPELAPIHMCRHLHVVASPVVSHVHPNRVQIASKSRPNLTQISPTSHPDLISLEASLHFCGRPLKTRGFTLRMRLRARASPRASARAS